jgi:hypothetical protein
MRGSRAASLLVCLLCAGLIGACGDESESAGPAEEFIAQADEVCSEAAREELANPQPTPTTAAEAVPVLEVALQRREAVLGAYEDLGEPPKAIAARWRNVVALTRQRYENTLKLLELARQRGEEANEASVALVAEAGRLGDRSEAILAGLGSTACARVLAPADREEVVAFVRKWETAPLSDCEAVTTADGIEASFGSAENCEEMQRQARDDPRLLTESIRVTDVEGVAGVTATVDATLSGGPHDGLAVRYVLLYEDGSYRVDSVTLQPGET